MQLDESPFIMTLHLSAVHACDDMQQYDLHDLAKKNIIITEQLTGKEVVVPVLVGVPLGTITENFIWIW